MKLKLIVTPKLKHLLRLKLSLTPDCDSEIDSLTDADSDTDADSELETDCDSDTGCTL